MTVKQVVDMYENIAILLVNAGDFLTEIKREFKRLQQKDDTNNN